MNTTKTLIIIDVQYDYIENLNGTTNYDLINIFNWLNKNKNKINKEYNQKIQIVDNLNVYYEEIDTPLNNTQIIQDKFINEEFFALENGILLNINEYLDYIGDKEDTDIIYNEFLENKHYISILDDIFYKEYGFLRDFMDYIRDSSEKEKLEQYIIDTIKILIDYDLSDTNEFDRDFINNLNISKEQKADFLEMYIDLKEEGNGYTPYNLALPNQGLIDNIYSNISKDSEIDLIGGGINECLKEIYLLLKGLDYKNVNIIEELTY